MGVVKKHVIKRSKFAHKHKTVCHLSRNGRCGPHYGNTICPAGYCSKWWWCGTSALHKRTRQARFDARPECMKRKKAKRVVKKVVKKIVKHAKKVAKKVAKKHPKKAKKIVKKAKKAAKKMVKKVKKAKKVKKVAKKVV